MNTKKHFKVLAFLLMLIMAISMLASCGGSSDDDDSDEKKDRTEDVSKSEDGIFDILFGGGKDELEDSDSADESESLETEDEEIDTGKDDERLYPEINDTEGLVTEPVTSESLLPESTAPIETAPIETAPVEITPPNKTPMSNVPYLEKVNDPACSIYSAPGYNNTYVGAVGVEGTFTIVEEAYDSAGNLWGKLKSGLGWIDLTKNRGTSSQLLSARRLSYSDRTDRMVVLSNGQYAQRIGFESSCDVLFAVYEQKYTGSGTENVFIADGTLKYGQVFCIQLDIHDTTTLIVEAVNIDGVKQTYLLCESGKDGSLVFAIQ